MLLPALGSLIAVLVRYDQLHWLDVPDSVLFKLAVRVHQYLNGRALPYLSEHRIPVSSADTRRHLRLPTVTYLPYRVSGSTLTAVGRFRLLARWSGTHSRILSGIQRAAQTVLGIYLKRTCSRVTSASSALGVLNDYALYKSTHSLTHLLALRRPTHRRRTHLSGGWADLIHTAAPDTTKQSRVCLVWRGGVNWL